ncbi:MAG: PKD domain-containing protein [bacterium]|nr:PKD domain-containing protein [bacterium]
MNESTIWTSDDVTNTIYHATLDGVILSSFPSGSVSGLAVDPFDNTIWAANEGTNRIVHFDRLGNQLSFFTGTTFDPATTEPEGVAVDFLDGTLWTVDDTTGLIYNVERTGSLIGSFPTSNYDAASTSPQAIAADPLDGTLWVTDNFADRIYNVTSGGLLISSFLTDTFGGSTNPQGISVDEINGTLWIADRVTHLVYNTERDGTLISSFDPLSYGSNDPTGVAFDLTVGTTLASDDFEVASGWTAGFAGDDATTGIWTRVDPVGTAAQPEDDHTPSPGINCFITGQHPGGGVGANDVDDGRTTLLSPLFDLTSATDPTISYWRWYSNDQGTTQDDVFEVLATDDGSTWVQVELIGPTGAGTSGGWVRHEFRVLDLPDFSLTNQVQLRFVASDLGGGSIVEAGVDDLLVFDEDCGTRGLLADFSGSPISGPEPLAVTFNDLSLGAVTSWSWDFGDGGTSNEQYPSHVYGASGSYTVSLTVTGSCGTSTETKTNYVNIGTTFISDDFEVASGWTVGFAGDDATTGIWTRVDPVGTAAQPEDDHTPSPGVNCFITGQHSGGGVGANDVDNGRTTLLSPVFDLTSATDPAISYWRWYSNDQGATQDDVFEVLATDDGSTWVQVELIGPTGAGTSGGWVRHEFRVLDLSGFSLTNQVQLRFVASDLGNGSIVEAGIDDLVVFESCGAPAPVAEFNGSPTSGPAPLAITFNDLSSGVVSSWSWNFGDGGTSSAQNPSHVYGASGSYTVSLTVTGPCGTSTETKTDYVLVDPPLIGTSYCSPAVANTTGSPATIVAIGSAVVTDNDVTLVAAQLPLGEFGYFLASPTQGFVANPGGSVGNLCLGGGPLLGRYAGMAQNSGTTGTFSIPVDLTAVPIAVPPGSVMIQPGDNWNFQCWYRDTASSNFTDAVSIDFE